MLRVLSVWCVLTSSAAFAQICPNGHCGGVDTIEATVTPADYQTLKATLASLNGRYRSLSEPCDKLVKVLARAETPDSVFSSTSFVTVSDHFFPIDLNTGAATLRLRFSTSSLGFSCQNQVYALKDGALSFAHLTIAD